MAETDCRYKKRMAATFRGGFIPACINDTEMPPPYVFTPCELPTERSLASHFFMTHLRETIIKLSHSFFMESPLISPAITFELKYSEY